ncbi:hypothetical protein EVAR_78420_1 [Eumeta japonica]|uniref:Uncharacterized protein n=1 Tax=Eumeta variegata TaxID=151549 RepID=A0A4C1TY21_EUMVA|nr:hypothetical protein EVAR_78420_1 [Eumeta japonica]
MPDAAVSYAESPAKVVHDEYAGRVRVCAKSRATAMHIIIICTKTIFNFPGGDTVSIVFYINSASVTLMGCRPWTVIRNGTLQDFSQPNSDLERTDPLKVPPRSIEYSVRFPEINAARYRTYERVYKERTRE